MIKLDKTQIDELKDILAAWKSEQDYYGKWYLPDAAKTIEQLIPELKNE